MRQLVPDMQAKMLFRNIKGESMVRQTLGSRGAEREVELASMLDVTKTYQDSSENFSRI